MSTPNTVEAATEATENDQANDQTTEPAGEESSSEATFTQADVDRIVSERLQRERAHAASRAERQAEQATKSAEDRIKALEDELASSKREALVRRVQAAHNLSDTDVDLFLTGADEETLTAQAKRLADRDSERKTKAPVVPNEGDTHPPQTNEEREFLRSLVQ